MARGCVRETDQLLEGNAGLFADRKSEILAGSVVALGNHLQVDRRRLQSISLLKGTGEGLKA